MSVVEVTYYQAVCDGCASNLSDDGEFSAWAERDGAIEMANGGAAVYEQDGFMLCEGCALMAVVVSGDDELLSHHDRVVAWAEERRAGRGET